MNWRNLPEHDYFLYARSFHIAARKLVRSLDIEPGPIPDFDLCPILSAYRHEVEVHLKAIVLGDGGNFLETRPDELSVHKTRSLSWLAQFVTQIVTALRGKPSLLHRASTVSLNSKRRSPKRTRLIRRSRRSDVPPIPSALNH